MTSTANNCLVKLVEAERKKFEDDEGYSPPPRIMQRCKAACRLIHTDLSKMPRQTRERNSSAQLNLAEILRKSADLFVLRTLTSTLTQIGSKRDYGLAPILIKWWTGVAHPENLSNISRQICREFGLQYPDNTDVSTPNDRAVRTPESSVSDIPDLTTAEMDRGDNNLPHEPGDSGSHNFSGQGFPAPHRLFGMTSFLGSECENQATGRQDQTPLNEQGISLQTTTPRRAQGILSINFTSWSIADRYADTNQIPRPENQPLQSVLSFQKSELLGFLDSPDNPWAGSMLPVVLPAACQDLRMIMPWSGTPLPCLEIKLEMPIEFSEASMKFRQSRLGVGKIEQKAAHKSDNYDLARGR